jgi:uncharacterized membrane protein YcaP (DUF421 family)
MSGDDLAHLLRLSEIAVDRRSEVKLAALEIDHRLSVLREPWAEPARRRDWETSREES